MLPSNLGLFFLLEVNPGEKLDVNYKDVNRFCHVAILALLRVTLVTSCFV